MRGSRLTTMTLTFGSIHARTIPPVREGSLWSHIAVVNSPGIPLILDPACPLNMVYFIQSQVVGPEGVEPSPSGSKPRMLP